jgi:hypothetical protein
MSGSARLLVYPSLPVRVRDAGWYDDVVSSVSLLSAGEKSGCCDGSSYFYVLGRSGHWHLGEYSRTWEVRRGVVGSLEWRLAELLGKVLPAGVGVSGLVESVVEACVAQLGCGVVFSPGEVSSVGASEWPDVDVLEYDESKARNALSEARRHLLGVHDDNVRRRRGASCDTRVGTGLSGAEVEALLRELRRLSTK